MQRNCNFTYVSFINLLQFSVKACLWFSLQRVRILLSRIILLQLDCHFSIMKNFKQFKINYLSQPKFQQSSKILYDCSNIWIFTQWLLFFRFVFLIFLWVMFVLYYAKNVIHCVCVRCPLITQLHLGEYIPQTKKYM